MDLKTATSKREILAIANRVIRPFGLSYLTFWSMHLGRTQADCIDLNTRPAFYVDHYINKRLILHDPIVLATFKTLIDLTWLETMSWQGWTEDQRAIVAGAREFGANNGLTVPLLSQDGTITSVLSVCGLNPDLSPEPRAALIGLASSVQQALYRVGGASRDAPHTRS